MKSNKWEDELLRLWEKRSDKQEEEGEDDIVDFDDLIIDVKEIIKENFISKEQAKKELKDNMLAEFYGDDNLSNKKYEKLLKRINKRIDLVLE